VIEMTEIRFRVWHKEQKQMYWFDIMWGDLCLGRGYIGMIPFGEKRKTCGIYRDDRIAIEPNSCEFMLFTGYKDKNGKDICVGDILMPGRREVQFGEYDTDLEQGTGFMTYSHDAEDPFRFPFSFASRQVEGSEIIGNIYENKELLCKPPSSRNK
jgi:uncharacterized phage protein (TIGR01671 family)